MALELKKLSYTVGSTEVLRDVSLRVERGERHILAGPSGAGKSTILKLIAGLERAVSGTIELNGVTLSDNDRMNLPPERRHVGYLPQGFALFPAMSVRENLEFAATNDDLVEHWVRTLGLVGLLTRYPGELSGGEAQRVALGRALVRDPSVLLLDEPFSNLDPPRRFALRAAMMEALEASPEPLPVLMVTHDREDIFALAHRVSILESGRLIESAEVDNLYTSPATTTGASSLGDWFPLDAEVDALGESSTIFGRCRWTGDAFGDVFGYRPEQVAPQTDGGGLNVRVVGSHSHGTFWRVQLTTDAGIALRADWSRPPEENSLRVQLKGPVLRMKQSQ